MVDPLSGQRSHAGIVRSIAGGRAQIAVAVQGCASCGQRKSCGVGKLASGGKTTLVTLPAPAGLRAGDAVTLSVEADALNRAALLGYLLPASLLVVGSVCGHAAAGIGTGGDLSDFGAAAGAAAGLTLGLLLLRLLPRFFKSAQVPLSID